MRKVRRGLYFISHHLERREEKVLGCWKSTADPEKRVLSTYFLQDRDLFFYGRKALS